VEQHPWQRELKWRMMDMRLDGEVIVTKSIEQGE
jgi:hypothetical protein